MATKSTTSPADVLALIDELDAALERLGQARADAIQLCERVEAATENTSRVWYHVARVARDIPDVLGGGASEFSLDAALVEAAELRDLAALAVSRRDALA
jgi:hypothetical protein